MQTRASRVAVAALVASAVATTSACDLGQSDAGCAWTLEASHLVPVDRESWDLVRVSVDGERVLLRVADYGEPHGLHPHRVIAVGLDGRPRGESWLEGNLLPEVGFGHAGALVVTEGARGAGLSFVPTDARGTPLARPRFLDPDYKSPGRLRATLEGFTYLQVRRRTAGDNGLDAELVRLDVTGSEIARVLIVSAAIGVDLTNTVDFDDGGFMVFMETWTAPAAQRFAWDGRADGPSFPLPATHAVARTARYGDGALFVTGSPTSPRGVLPLFEGMRTQVVAVGPKWTGPQPYRTFDSHLPLTVSPLPTGDFVVVTAFLASRIPEEPAVAPSEVHVLSPDRTQLARLDLGSGPHAFSETRVVATREGAVIAHPDDGGIRVTALRCR